MSPKHHGPNIVRLIHVVFGFQHAIDRAAAVAGLTETESYVAQWRRVSSPLASDPVQAAIEAVSRFNDDYPRDRLEQLLAQGRIDPSND